MKNYYEELKGTMTPEKKASAKNDLFAFYVGRPLSYFITIPFLLFKVKPNTVSVISLIEVICASFLLSSAKNTELAVLGILLFFLWNLLDGVDGNIARLKKISTPMGSVYDALSGYAAMFLTFFSMGIYSFNINGNYLQIVIGALSGMSLILPRLIMHKAKNETNSNTAKEIADKSTYSLSKVVALNLTSISGMVQPLMLFSTLFHVVSAFNVIYCFINLAVMVISIYKILSEK